MTMRRSNKDRTEATRAALLTAARALFVEQGFAESSTPQIVAKSAVTRGALYHHFTDKADVLRAVVVAEAQAVADAITAATSGLDEPIAALTRGADAYFDAMTEPGRARILLLEAPVVLGSLELAKIDKTTGGQTLVHGLKAAAAAGQLKDVPLEPLADILSAAFDRAALAIAEGAPAKPYREATHAMLRSLLR